MSKSQFKKHTPEQIVSKLRKFEQMRAEGLTIPLCAKRLGVTVQTLNRWRNEFGGMTKDEASRLKLLEQENSQLKRIVADQALDIRMLKDLTRGKF
jgi:DNA-binding transcriptional regulator YiaG